MLAILANISRAFRPLDTSVADAAVARAETLIERADGEHHAIRVRARALRIGIGCPDATETIQAAVRA